MTDKESPVLRCAQCHKPFDKQSTLKRHGYYCRTIRKTGPRNPVTHARSCHSCAKSKVACDGKQPQCSRCAAKSVDCHYLASRRRRENSELRHKDARQIENSTSVDQSNLELFVADLNFGNGQSPLDASVARVESLDLLHPEIPDFDDLFSIPSILEDKDGSITSVLDKETHPNQFSSCRPSYVQMIFRPNTVHPFLHSTWMSGQVAGLNHDLEPLHNCNSLLYMVRSQIHGSRKLFWRNVRAECERFRDEYKKMSKWGLLAAMQAIAIYIILKLEEGENEYNQIDSLLVASIFIIASRFNKIYTAQPDLDHDIYESRWQNWIFEESGRRISVICQLLNLIVYFEPAEMCDSHTTGLILAPLPSRKQLWSAPDMYAWETETGLFPDSPKFGLTTKGDLVKLDMNHVYRHGGENAASMRSQQSLMVGGKALEKANWEDWCIDMDGFGTLVMLAASLQE